MEWAGLLMGLANSTANAIVAGMPPLRLAIAGCEYRAQTCARLAANFHPCYHNFMAFSAELSRSEGGHSISLTEVRG